MELDGQLDVGGNRVVGFADYGPDDGSVVLWCHGGPGCRLSPGYVAPMAAHEGIRIVGIGRPGYGLSSPQPGRTIADWVEDASAVADRLGIATFDTVGTSTGGAYALAAAALLGERVAGAVACCSVTDMRYTPARETMSRPHAIAVWDAQDRDAAIAAAIESHGMDGSRIMASAEGQTIPITDQAMLSHPWGRNWIAALPQMFAHGVEGYTDDRLADGNGWVSFEVSDITCPVIVLQGDADVMTTPIHAVHTASIVPNAELRVLNGLGHFSIEDHIVPAILDLHEELE